jgi:hypothetical protein
MRLETITKKLWPVSDARAARPVAHAGDEIKAHGGPISRRTDDYVACSCSHQRAGSPGNVVRSARQAPKSLLAKGLHATRLGDSGGLWCRKMLDQGLGGF